MSRVKHVIHQYDDGAFIQLIIIGEVYLRQVVVTMLLLDVIERGMGRTDQVAVTVNIQPFTQVIGDIIRITGHTCLTRHGNKYHPLTFRLGNTREDCLQFIDGIVNRFRRTVLLHLMGKTAQLLTTLPYAILA